MADEIHPVVELLAKRMQSHPDEFRFDRLTDNKLPVSARWDRWLTQIGMHMNDAESRLLFAAARSVAFERIFEEVTDDLLNGDDRRAKEQEEAKRLWMQQQTIQQQLNQHLWQQQMQTQGYAANSIQNALGSNLLQSQYNHQTQQYEHRTLTNTMTTSDPATIQKLKRLFGK